MSTGLLFSSTAEELARLAPFHGDLQASLKQVRAGSPAQPDQSSSLSLGDDLFLGTLVLFIAKEARTKPETVFAAIMPPMNAAKTGEPAVFRIPKQYVDRLGEM